MSSSRCLAAVLAVALVPSGCIRTKTNEGVSVTKEAPRDGLRRFARDGIDGGFGIYRPATMPLEDFFSRLASGEFDRALAAVDIQFRPGSTENKAITKLLEEGVVPVYLQLKNGGSRPVTVSEQVVRLVGDGLNLAPIPPQDVPRRFKEFSPKAIGANVYNTGAVVVVFAAMLAMSLFMMGARPTFILGRSPEIYNSPTKTTMVSYQNFLFAETQLKPGDTAMGLVLFKAESAPDFDALSLDFAPGFASPGTSRATGR